jgi:hypothetical protein
MNRYVLETLAKGIFQRDGKHYRHCFNQLIIEVDAAGVFGGYP